MTNKSFATDPARLEPAVWHIGPVALPNRVLLAPMAGITDAPVRRIADRYGAGLVTSEMIAADWLLDGATPARRKADGAGLTRHAVQLAGCTPESLAAAARHAEAGGASLIDINMGCPVKRVTGGEAGAALMRDLDHAERLVAAVVGAVSVPVTVKMRLGWDERARLAPDLARRAERAGASAVTVHGRTRSQFYTGQADWDAIGEVVRAVAIPVVANGDVLTVSDAVRIRARSGAAAVMIGRGAQGRPWLPGRIARALADGAAEAADPPIAEQLAVAEELYGELLAHHGTAIGARVARKHLGWGLDVAAETLGAAPDIAKAWRKRVTTEEDPAAVPRRLREAFDALAWRTAA